MFKKLLLIAVLQALCVLSYSQVVNTGNFSSYDFTTISCNNYNGSFLVTSEMNLDLYRGGKKRTIDGYVGLFSKDGKRIYSFGTQNYHTSLNKFDNEGTLLKQITIEAPFVGMCIANDKIYALTGARTWGRMAANSTSDWDDYFKIAEVIEIDTNLNILNRWETTLLMSNMTNISYYAGGKKLIIGSGISGVYMNLSGEIIGTYNTPHGAFTMGNNEHCYSILHKYSDGSYITFYFDDSAQSIIKKELQKPYKLYKGLKTDRAVFTCWDINSNNTLIVTLDHSNTLSVYNKEGNLLADLDRSKHIEYVFFISDDVICYFDSKKQKVFSKSLKEYMP